MDFNMVLGSCIIPHIIILKEKICHALGINALGIIGASKHRA